MVAKRVNIRERSFPKNIAKIFIFVSHRGRSVGVQNENTYDSILLTCRKDERYSGCVSLDIRPAEDKDYMPAPFLNY